MLIYLRDSGQPRITVVLSPSHLWKRPFIRARIHVGLDLVQARATNDHRIASLTLRYG